MELAIYPPIRGKKDELGESSKNPHCFNMQRVKSFIFDLFAPKFIHKRSLC